MARYRSSAASGRGTCPAGDAWGRPTRSWTRAPSALASILDAKAGIDRIVDSIVYDPADTYRFSLPSSILKRKRGGRSDDPTHRRRSHHPARRPRQDRDLPRRPRRRRAGLLQVPELRGFEQFTWRIRSRRCPRTPRICGALPDGPYMAASKAADAVYVEPPPTAKKLRLYAFFMEDHTLHFFFLGGPDFVVRPQAPRPSATSWASSARSAWKLGKVIKIREDVREIMAYLCGKAIHPVGGLPGGVSKGHGRGARGQVPGHRQGIGRVRRVRPPDLQRRRPQEQDLCRHRRGTDQDLLHGPGQRPQ